MEKLSDMLFNPDFFTGFPVHSYIWPLVCDFCFYHYHSGKRRAEVTVLLKIQEAVSTCCSDSLLSIEKSIILLGGGERI
jgi:hypothetical protein